ncbi:hypothetical protein ABPG72_018391 [Tetrahymena utriculariae]
MRQSIKYFIFPNKEQMIQNEINIGYSIIIKTNDQFNQLTQQQKIFHISRILLLRNIVGQYVLFDYDFDVIMFSFSRCIFSFNNVICKDMKVYTCVIINETPNWYSLIINDRLPYCICKKYQNEIFCTQRQQSYLYDQINDFNLQIFPFDTLQKQRLDDEEYCKERVKSMKKYQKIKYMISRNNILINLIQMKNQFLITENQNYRDNNYYRQKFRVVMRYRII